MYIVIDDIGYGWIDTFGGMIRTPNITKLGENGLRYTNFTTTALCSPTRSCLLTGRNHHSVGMANIPELASGFPGYNGRQPQNKAGIAAMLHGHGYTSFCMGKWHNTPSEETGISGPYDRWPTGSVFGFDRFYGFLGGDSDQWYPKLFLDREAIDQPRLPEEGYHLSEDLAERTMSWLAQHKSLAPSKPWLAYLAFGAMHAPHHIWSEWADRYKGQFDIGWDAYREQTLARQKEMGILPESAELSPMLEGTQRWDDLSPDEKRLFARMAEIYAGYMEPARAKGRSTAYSTSSRCRSSRVIRPRRSSATSRASTSSACPARTTTIRRAGRSPATRRSSSVSSTRIGAARGTRSSSIGPRASRPRASCGTSTTT